MTTTVLQYHEIRGLAAPLRMMLEYAGIEYDNKYADEWFSKDKAEVKKVNALANLPTLYQPDGTIVTQSCACFFAVGEMAGLNGDSDAERSRVDQINCQVMDLRNAAVKVFYAKRTETTFDDHSRTVLSNYTKLEGAMRRWGYIYSAANKPRNCDFHLWEMIDQHEEFARAYNKPSFVTGYALLRAFYARFREIPALQAYFDGPLHKLPINNPKFCSFGGDPTDFTKMPPIEGQEDAEVDTKIYVGYWKIRGLAAPLRMMCTFADADFESVEYECPGNAAEGFDRSSWLVHAKPALRDLNPLMNLPYVKVGQELVTQSNACIMFLARKFGLAGDSPATEAKIHQVMWQTTDLRNGAVGRFYNRDHSAAAAEKYCAEVAASHYAKLEGWLKQQGTKFTASDEITASDFHVFEMLDQHEEYAKATGQPSFLAGGQFPCLAQLHQLVREHPKLATYFASPMHKLPVNNTMAGFGAAGDYSKINAFH